MKTLIILAVFALSSVAWGQDNTVKQAAETVARLHDSMLNPPTFVLDGVYLSKPDRKGHPSLCYEYRSQNASGGMSAGRAAVYGWDTKRLNTFVVERGDDVQGYNAGWVSPCKAKNIDREITKDVAAIAPALYRKDK